MTPDKFIQMVKNYGGWIIALNSDQQQIYYKMEKMRGLFKYIDFSCQMTDTGGCKEGHGPICCCHNCYDSAGYLRVVPEDKVKQYAKQFRGKIGFWREDTGCVLPHKQRSKICLCHHCNHEDKQFAEGLYYLKRMIEKDEHRIIDQ